jgi:pyrimidine operon attenuation protein / uracil phosphoribosyltransferase
METARTKIMSTTTIAQKLERIAYQVYENNFDEKEIVLIGISGNGEEVCNRLLKILKSICEIKITAGIIKIDKKNPHNNTISTSIELNYIEGKSVVLVDDVLNSGITLMYATRYLLNVRLSQLITVVLVDRRHRKFPIKADFVGITLSTTIQENISVEFSEKEDAIYLE